VTGGIELTVISQGTRAHEKGVLPARYAVHGRFDRQAFGLHWNQDLDVGGIVVGDRVAIDAHVEMIRTADADYARTGDADENPAAPGQP